MAFAVRGFLLANTDPAGDVTFFSGGHDAGGPQHYSDVQWVLCYFVHEGHNNPSSVVKLIKASTGGNCCTSDVLCTVPRAPVLPSPAPAIAGGSIIRRRAGKACVQHQLRAATTADLVTRAQGTAAIAPSPGAAVTLLSEFIAASRCHSVATAPKPQPISGRTRSRTVQVFDAPRIHLSGTPEESISSPPVPRKHGLHHRVGWLLSTISKTALLSMETYTGSRRRRPWQQAVQFWGPRGSRHFPLATTKRHHRLCGPSGLQCVIWRRRSLLGRTST